MNYKEIENQIFKFDKDLYCHCKNTGDYVCIFGENIFDDMDLLKLAGRIHDIGKIYISKNILMKPGPLSSEERKEIDKHSLYGYQILQTYGVPEDLCSIVLMHHGNYTEGCDKRLVLAANILRAADIFDAVTSVRPYHQAMSCEDAYNIVKTQKNPIPDVITENVRKYTMLVH